jgi:hypothetical protein
MSAGIRKRDERSKKTESAKKMDISQTNLKAKPTMKKAYGCKTLKCLQIASDHTLGELPELSQIISTDYADGP